MRKEEIHLFHQDKVDRGKEYEFLDHGAAEIPLPSPSPSHSYLLSKAATRNLVLKPHRDLEPQLRKPAMG